MPVVSLGFVRDQRLMALAYQAADVFVCPSVEDAGPMMIIESLSCHTPAVAFRVVGSHEAILSGVTGIVIEDISAAALADAILRALCLKPDAACAENAFEHVRRASEPHAVAREFEAFSRELAGRYAAWRGGANERR